MFDWGCFPTKWTWNSALALCIPSGQYTRYYFLVPKAILAMVLGDRVLKRGKQTARANVYIYIYVHRHVCMDTYIF